MVITVSPTIRSEEVPITIARNGRVGLDLDEGQVHHRVVLEDPSRIGRAVGKLDHDALNLVHDMMVGEDVAAGIDDDPAPHPVDPRPLVLLGGERPPAVRLRLLLAGDIHDARLDSSPPPRRRPSAAPETGPALATPGAGQPDRQHGSGSVRTSQKSLSASQQGHWHGGHPHCIETETFPEPSRPANTGSEPGNPIPRCNSWLGSGSVTLLATLSLVVPKSPSFPGLRNYPQDRPSLPRPSF